jgi:hypothetical protein
MAVGVYIPGGAQDTSLLDGFEAMVGRQMEIVHWYQPWGYTNGWYASPLDTDALRAIAARGAVPLITWEAWGTVNGADPSHLATIPTGAFDDYIDSWAHGLKAFGRPVFLRLFHEMNTDSYPWGYGVNGNSAQNLITAWRYVHNRFAAIGATNVRWVWSPNTVNARVAFRDIYPGDAYVDWFGVDGYNGGAALPAWGGWRSPQQIFADSYRAFQSINPTKSIMIAETSSVEAGGDKAGWITNLFTTPMTQSFPNIRAIVWFDADLTTKGQGDWLVNTSDSSLEAFRAVITRLGNAQNIGS